MLLLIRSMKDLHFGKLTQVYEESCPTLDAQSDFYQYLRQVFFRTSGAVYCVWQEGENYTSALRLEPYRDGLLLNGLETAPAHRRQGYAGTLLDAVLAAFGDAKIYSHIDQKNQPSRALHTGRGFEKLLDCATFLDGSASNQSATYLWQK